MLEPVRSELFFDTLCRWYECNCCWCRYNLWRYK